MRTHILDGNLPLPGYDKFNSTVYLSIIEVLDNMWHSLWHNYCAKRQGTSAIHWLEQAGKENTALFLAALRILQKSNWIEITTTDNFSVIKLSEPKLLQYVTAEELSDIRFSKRFHKYLPVANISSQKGKARVRANGLRTNRFLDRPGMEIGAKSEFTFDKTTLLKHIDIVTAEANKGMLKVLDKYPELMLDDANYANVTEEIIKYLAEEDIICNMGINYVDSRGRAIKSHLSKVANPIGFKVFRALLVIPEEHRKPATDAGMDNILLFIAELNGYKSGTAKDKLQYGTKCWLDKTLPHEPHEAIWCERLYSELYAYEISKLENSTHYWSTPLELDAAASLLQYIGVLLNDRQLMEATNLISTGDLVDPWGLIKTVSRKQTKPCIMRQVYGSSQSSATILDDQDVDYTPTDIAELEKGLHEGAYGVANAMKKFVIGNATMDEVIFPVVWKEQLQVPCNRHHVHGERPIVYTLVDSKGSKKRVIHWKTVKTPDLKSFKRWTMTGLIHSLDSRVIDRVMSALSWGIDIHDAVIVNPEDANLVRETYAKAMEAVHADRISIMNDYFASVGIKFTAKAKKQWAELTRLVTPLDEPFKCSRWAMK